MLLIKEYCERVRDDAYGGSAELVDDGILTLKNELNAGSFGDGDAVLNMLTGCVDDILGVASSILPLINLLIACLHFADVRRGTGLTPDDAVREANTMLDSARERQSGSLERIGGIGARMISDGDRVSTFSTSGSVMAIYSQAVAQGKRLSASAFEARPHNEGYRTLAEISAMGIPVTFGVEALLYELIPGTDIFFIGADAVRATGEVYAKTGSCLAALVCREFGIPFYVAADTSKFDAMSLMGYPLKDSSRPPEEVSDMTVPSGSVIKNVSFELIPPRLVTGIITEKGVVSPYAVANMMDPDSISGSTIDKLAAWAKKN